MVYVKRHSYVSEGTNVMFFFMFRLFVYFIIMDEVYKY